MTPSDLNELVRGRIRTVRETLREAEILARESAWRGAINRAYYAMFYAVSALLATKGLGASKHSAALTLFDREFVKTGQFPPETSRILGRAFDRKQTCDYGESAIPDSALAEDALADATSFVASAESFLRSSGFLSDPV